MPISEVKALKSYLSTDTAIQTFAPLGQVICLSGCWGLSNTSLRYDIISAAPSHQLREQNKLLNITDENYKAYTEDITGFEWIDKHFKKPTTTSLKLTPNKFHHLPLLLGFIGYVSYDYGRLLEKLPSTTIDDTNLPDFCGGVYHWNLINDKQAQTSYLVFGDSCPPLLKESILSAVNRRPRVKKTFTLTKPFAKDLLRGEYQSAFTQISRYISEGDCYQINYAHRHQSQYTGDPATAYSWLNNRINTPYSAYLQLGDHHILSLSPERFIKVDGNRVETKPIKGTRPRGSNKNKDSEQISLLLSSLKDRAENLMIVDLLRNDLNKTCIQGTVKVPELFKIETYPNVHHLVSTIVGNKLTSTSPLEVFKQAFPGGSITGAPKIRAMEIIEELEPTRRSIYCGSIFYAGFDGGFDSNICIRTLLCKDDSIYCWGGGGIVSDSNCDDEYQESITKIKNLMDELEHMSGLK